MQCHTSATCTVLPGSAAASFKAPSDHQGCYSRQSKIFPYVVAFSLLSNYDPTYYICGPLPWVSSLDFGLGLDNLD